MKNLRFKQVRMDFRINDILEDISKKTCKSKKQSSILVADFLETRKEDLNSFASRNKKRRNNFEIKI